ncbi:MAG: hypothetical protein MUF24_03110 [Chitinophagaceae bacterium]|nr:hypothetical protein [Chitinophagaceae bacterium]
MSFYHQPLMPNQIYHVFSRVIGKEKLFLSDENYLYFLRKLKEHTGPVCDYYCYSLLPNHFHLLVKIKDEPELLNYFNQVKKVPFNPLAHNLSDFVMERFGNFLNSYTKSFNKMYHRKGALFLDYLNRSKVRKDSDFSAFVWYIHKNAVHHKLKKSIGEWKYDSYLSILSHAPTSLLRQEIMDWFGDKEAFVKFHQQPIILKGEIDFIDV